MQQTNRHKRRECPVCKTEVFNIPRHLQQKHNLPKEQARNWKQTYTNEIDWETFRRGSAGKKRAFRQCPLCQKHVTRLDKHMKKIHAQKEIPENKLDPRSA